MAGIVKLMLTIFNVFCAMLTNLANVAQIKLKPISREVKVNLLFQPVKIKIVSFFN